MKYLFAILLFCLPGYAADVHLGRLQDLTWDGSGADRVAVFGQAEPPSPPGVITNTQDWTGWTGVKGPFTSNDWTLSAGVRASTSGGASAPSVRFFSQETPPETNAYILFPQATSGMGYIEMYLRNLSGSANEVVYFERSTDGTNDWSVVWNLPNNNQLTTTFTKYSTNLNLSGSAYYRIRRPDKDPDFGSAYYVDDILWTTYEAP